MSSKPSNWVLLSSAADVAIVSTLALSGTLMEPLPWRILAEVAIAALGFQILCCASNTGVIHAGKQATDPSGCGMTTRSVPRSPVVCDPA